MDNKFKKVVASTLLLSILTYTMPIFATMNEETIYSKLNSSGEKYKSIVSVNKDYEINQSEIDKSLPIDCDIKYELDGKEIDPKELIGKSGKVKITLEYTNKTEVNKKINGKFEKMYTPFLVISGTIIDNKNNSNIKITNGKIIENKDNTVAVGICLPGLSDSLKIDSKDIDIPSKIEITMDTKYFEMDNIMTYCTPKVLDEDIKWNKLDDIFDQAATLQDSTNQLEDGSILLKDSVVVLADGVKQLDGGASTLQTGVNSLKDGTTKLNKGANDLKSGTNLYAENYKQFSNGINKISGGVDALHSGYSQIDNGIKAINANTGALGTGTQELEAGSKALSQGLAGVDENLGKIQTGTQGISAGIDTVDKSVEELQKGSTSLVNGTVTLKNGITQINEKVNAIGGTDFTSQIAQLKGMINANNNTINVLNASNVSLNTTIAALEDEATKQVLLAQVEMNSNSIASLNANNQALNATITGLNGASVTGVNELKQAIGAIQKGATDLNTGANTLNLGLGKLKTGTGELATKSKDLVNGSNQLKAGTSTLATKSKDLVLGTGKLKTGVTELSKGAQALGVGSTQTKKGIDDLHSGIYQKETGLLSANNQLLAAANKINEGANGLALGSQELNSGVDKLVEGSNVLRNGTKALVDGSNQLQDGTKTLSDGVHELNEQGISKICRYVNVDLNNLVKRGKTLEQLSKEYVSYASDEERESINFIMIIDSLKTSAKEETNEEIVLEDNKVKIEKSSQTTN